MRANDPEKTASRLGTRTPAKASTEDPGKTITGAQPAEGTTALKPESTPASSEMPGHPLPRPRHQVQMSHRAPYKDSHPPPTPFRHQTENPRKPRDTVNAPGSLQRTPHKRCRTPPSRPTQTNKTETKRPQNKSAAPHRHPLMTAPPGTPRAQPSSGEPSAPGMLPDHPRSPDLRCRSRRHPP